MRFSSILAAAAGASTALACDGCYGSHDVVMTRHVRRMQPDAQNATTGPRGPLEWGQLNFIQTTDTHGWLEGHIKEENYGADWGDFVSFTRHMKDRARNLGVDLLLVDTGDLHDGAGLSDGTSPNGMLSNPIFENIDYDLLTIGNHELYVTEIAYEHFNQFSKVYGERYLTSNVEIVNPSTGQFEYIGHKYRYFTTEQGLRIMAFGVLFDFTGNSNVSRVTKAQELIKQQWFLDAVNYEDPIDMFVVIGHNPIRANVSSSTFGTLYSTIRSLRPDVPITALGGHTHIRDFVVYDSQSVGIESGQYCETVGWLAINGIKSDCDKATQNPPGVPVPTRPAVPLGNSTSAPSTLRYARRYLDWNRRTFAYHASGSQDNTFDTQHGKAVSSTITGIRQQLNLTKLYGCAPQSYCQYCAPFGSNGSIYSLLQSALAATVINTTRADIPRLLIANSGGVRFDLAKGPFTYDDSFIVIPFLNKFLYIPNVPYEYATQVVPTLNAGPFIKKRDLETRDFGFNSMHLADRSVCLDPPIFHDHIHARDTLKSQFTRRQSTAMTPGLTTTDDFGTDGDDTPHSRIPSYDRPNVFQANGSFPATGTPETVDLVFYDFIQTNVLSALTSAGASYTSSDVGLYMPAEFTSNSYLPAYAKLAWQQNMPNCPVGQGIGFD